MTIQELYNKHIKGEVSKEKFLYEIHRDINLSPFITKMTSYTDAVKILKNRGILTEARKKVEALSLDQSNPYEYKKGIDYELELCARSTPNILPEDYQKAQKTVLTNLAKDPNFYTKTLAGQKPEGDLASDAELGESTKRSDVYYKLSDNNLVDKANGVKEVSKKEKSNVQDTLGQKEKAKKKVPKGVQVMTMTPKKGKAKGIKVMAMPGKEKKIKLKETKKNFSLLGLLEAKTEPKFIKPTSPTNSSTVSNYGKNSTDKKKYGNDPHFFVGENIPASNPSPSFIPFANVKPGMTAKDDSGESFKILAVGDYNKVKRYDSSKAMDRFLSSDPTGIDGNQLVALMDKDGNTLVRVYGTGGIYVYDNSQMSEYSNEEDLKNKEKSYLQAKIKADQDRINSLRETNMRKIRFSELFENDNLESDIASKNVPQDIESKAEAKAAILVTITKAKLNSLVDLDNDIAVRAGYIWVKVNVGTGSISSEQLKSLCSDSKFKGVNPISDSEITLVFDKK